MTARATRDGAFGPATMQFLQKLCEPGDEQLDLRVALVCAHPDDETIGAGTRFVRLPQVAIVHVTDGAPRSREDALRNGFQDCASYSAARREELQTAVKMVGVRRDQLYELGFPDQAVAHNLGAATRALRDFLIQFSPTVVITHPYEGGHPDHDATAFAVHAAITLSARESEIQPALLEMTSYHNCNGELAAGEFLPSDGNIPVTTAWLNPQEQDLKRRMFACFRTQVSVLSQFPVDAERFRPAPRYNFLQTPHTGTLFYEQYPWGMTGIRFRACVAEALQELRLK